MDFFHLLSVETSQAQLLFELIDADGSGTVDSNEIVQACMRLKGEAKAFDVAITQQRLEGISATLDAHITKVDQHLGSLAASMNRQMGGGYFPQHAAPDESAGNQSETAWA